MNYTVVLDDIYSYGNSNNDEIEPIGQQWKSNHLMPIAEGVLDKVFGSPESVPIDKRVSPDDGMIPDLLISGYFSTLENILICTQASTPSNFGAK